MLLLQFKPTQPATKHQATTHLLLPHPLRDEKEKYKKGLEDWDNDREGLLTNYGNRQKSNLAWGKEHQFNLNNKITNNLPIKTEYQSTKSTTRSGNHLPHPPTSLFPRLSAARNFLYLFPPSSAGRWAMGVAVCHHTFSTAPSSSVGGLLTVLPAATWHLWTSPVNPSHEAAVLHELLQHGSLLWGAVLLAADCSGMDFLWNHGVLRTQPPAPVWSLPWAAGGHLSHNR